MSNILERMQRKLADRQRQSNGPLSLPPPKRFVLSKKNYVEFMQVCTGMMRYTSPSQPVYTASFMGVPVDFMAPKGECRTCGAPAEPDECSYCHTPSEFIELKD